MAETLSQDELEFVKAVEKFKKAKGKPFPSLSELLMVLKDLGYRRQETARKKNLQQDAEAQECP